ncbi:MAG TPA: 2-isopropylmalate synthase, partial [Bacteroidetes bacterium]|nr:2-isopropylmalate synthase [Bacteroidota bacterium]
MEKRLHIFDTTLRDGEQSPGCSMNLEEKVRMARKLEELGVDVIEAGFPVASQGDFEAVRSVARTIRQRSVAALARALRSDIDRAWEAIRDAVQPRIHVFIATSDIHMKHKLNKTRSQVLADTLDTVRYARSLCSDVEFSCEDASRSDLVFLSEVIRTAIGAGATVINLPDTVGYATPAGYGAMFRAVRNAVPETAGIILSAHCHNDLGLAVANSLAAIESGVLQVECTINGIGER